ncbi:MAG TPA: universal stress protein [Vicinamibacteria bacterium]|nr:universal stress protein [Vicinamibacteria bacterium]
MDNLVYVDPSPRGEWALAMVALLPPDWRSSLHLVATAEDVAAHPGLLERARVRLGVTGSVQEVVLHGPAERAMVAEATARHFDLLVVPPAGRSAVARLLKGSRVATVVSSVRAPVLVARRPPARLDRVLAAVSGGRSTAPVIRVASALAQGLGAELRFVHVASEVALPFGGEAAHPAVAPVESVQRMLAAAGGSSELAVREGLVVEEVLEEFEDGAHHLLVLGMRGEAAPSSWGREDVTERILLRCPGSTLIVPGT